MRTPAGHGPLSGWVHQFLTEGTAAPPPPVSGHDALRDLDLQSALWMLYELHYSGFEDAPAELEWDPRLLAFRRQLEEPFEEAVRLIAAPLLTAAVDPGRVLEQLSAMIDSAPGPDLARYLQRDADLDQFLNFMRRRSIYHLKESDPQSFVLARIPGPAKAALAELQYDEYGAGRPERLHQRLFAEALDGCGLSSDYGAHIAHCDAATLAVNNVMSLFALHRRLRGASLGHLAAFEATSSVPCRRIAAGIRRLRLPEATAAYYDEHVEADAAHEQVAIRDICGRALAHEPELAEDVLWGAAACLTLDALAAEDLLADWGAQEQSPRGAA